MSRAASAGWGAKSITEFARSGCHEWSRNVPAGPLRGQTAGTANFVGNHVEDAVLPMLEEDQIPGLNRCRYVCDSKIVTEHVVNANWYSEHVWNRAMARCANSMRG